MSNHDEREAAKVRHPSSGYGRRQAYGPAAKVAANHVQRVSRLKMDFWFVLCFLAAQLVLIGISLGLIAFLPAAAAGPILLIFWVIPDVAIILRYLRFRRIRKAR